MALFKGSSKDSTNSSSSTSESWLFEYLSPVMIDFIESNPGIDYIESGVADLTDAQKQALDAYKSGASIDAGKSIMQGGAGLVSDSIANMQRMLGGGTKAAFTNGVSGIMGAMAPAMENQAAAIQDDVYADMAGAFGGAAQSTMSNTAVTNSSNAEMTTNAVMASGANAMTQGIAEMQAGVLSSAIGLTTDALSTYAGINSDLLGVGGDMFKAGGGMVSSGTKNMFNAGLFEQMFNQENINNDRKNDMINGNMEWIDMAALMAVTMPGAGLKTESSSESSVSSDTGWF
ncbi:UNVERIFIED_ORG: hypothetical protein J2Y78_002040 [Buttiauxella agrestis ATCC 33320]